MRQIVEKITDKPVVVLITHVDGDHIHCLGQFEEAWMSPSEYARFHNDTGTDFICWIITALISAPASMISLTCMQILFKSRQFFAWLDHNIYLLRGGPHLPVAECCRMGASSFESISIVQRCKDQAWFQQDLPVRAKSHGGRPVKINLYDPTLVKSPSRSEITLP